MDVILVFPHTGPKKTIWAPLSLLYLAEALREDGFSTRIIDTRVEKDYIMKLKNFSKKDCIFGFSVMAGHQIIHAIQISQHLKKLNSNSKVVWGGTFPTLCPEACLQSLSIDVVVMGEGEITFPELAHCIEQNGSLDQVKGIAYKDTHIRSNPDRPLIDMDKLPFPAWDLVDATNYFRNDFAKRILPVQTSRGCPNRCTFCYTVPFSRGVWRSHRAERVISEIQMLVEKYKIDGVDFCDDNFFVGPDRVRKICNSIIAENLNICWRADCTVDILANMNTEYLSLLKDSGCKSLFLGADSASKSTLKQLGKNATPEQTIEAVKRCAQYGIIPVVSMIIGFENEDYETVNETLDFVDELKRLNPETLIAGLKMITPYSGTKLYEDFRASGLKQPEKLEDWSRFVPTNPSILHSDPEFDRFLQVLAYASWFALGGSFINDNVPTSFPYSTAKEILTLLAKWRWKRRFWKLPIEWKLVILYDRYFDSNVGRKLSPNP